MDGAVYVSVFVALDMLVSRKQHRKALARKRSTAPAISTARVQSR